MASSRRDRRMAFLEKTVAEFFQKEPFEKSMVTVTGITLSKDSKNATVSVSLYPPEEDVHALRKLRARGADLREYVKTAVRMKFIPFFSFEIDRGEEKREKIDALFKKMAR